MFKELINVITPLLKQMGFNKKGNSFYLEFNKNYGVVNFQKSRESTNDMVKFTINFGVYSNVLGRMLYGYSDSSSPAVDQCHWQSRIGDFMPGSPDYWWNINMSNILSDISVDVMDSIENIVFPQLSKRMSDEGLINSWMNENYAGTTEIGRFKYLTTLLKVKGDFNTLNQVIEAFMQKSKGKPNFERAIDHLREIEYNM